MSNTSEAIESVDFYAAIQAHVLWRRKLEEYIAGNGDEKLDANTVGCDDHCALGEWLYGSGGRYIRNHPRFTELQQAHACFHRYAGEVIRCADSGDNNKARELLNGEYAACSQKVKMNLARIGLDVSNE